MTSAVQRLPAARSIVQSVSTQGSQATAIAYGAVRRNRVSRAQVDNLLTLGQVTECLLQISDARCGSAGSAVGGSARVTRTALHAAPSAPSPALIGAGKPMKRLTSMLKWNHAVDLA